MPGKTDTVSLHFETLRVFQTVVVTDGCFDTAEESVEREKFEESKMNQDEWYDKYTERSNN